MLERYFRPDRAEALRSGRLGSYLDSFSRLLTHAGYAASTARLQLRLVADAAEWLHRRRQGTEDLDESAVAAFLAARRRHHRRHLIDRPTLRRFVEHLEQQGVITMRPKASPEETPTLRLEQRYDAYLRKERGLCAKTIRNHRVLVHRFLSEWFGKMPVKPSVLQAADVSRFIIKYNHRRGAKYAQAMVGALRSFFRFLQREGETQVDLTAALPTVPCWRNGGVPRYLSDIEVRRLLASCNTTTAIGRRDHAVLLLLARLGLRAGEVSRLQLGDIDWRAGEICVFGKGQVRDRLPLLPEVGRALVAYLRRDRPSGPVRHVFVRAIAPRRAIGPSAVTTIVRRAIERAGLEPPFKGAHVLRHTLATKLLRSGASMSEIAEVLRHRNTVTTEIYAKVDIGGLRALAQLWPTPAGGGAR